MDRFGALRLARGMWIGLVAFAVAALGAAPAMAQGRDAPGPRSPCAAPATHRAPARVTEQGDVTWEGGAGRVLGLAPGSGGPAALAAALRAWAAAGPFAAVVIDPAADRWGRVAVQLVRGGRTASEDLVSAGEAVVRPDGVPVRCLKVLLDLERAAWPGAAPAARGEDRAAIAGADGRFMLVEGRILSIGSTARTLYLNFGGLGANDFAVTIPKRSLRRFEASGMTNSQLQGRRVRVRGVVVGRDRPRMEVTVPEALERLD